MYCRKSTTHWHMNKRRRTIPIEWPLKSVFKNKYGKIWCWLRNYEYLWEFTNSLIPVCHRYATIHFYSVFFKYLLVYQYLDSLPTNTLTFDIHTIRSGIRWTNPSVKNHYSPLSTYQYTHPYTIHTQTHTHTHKGRNIHIHYTYNKYSYLDYFEEIIVYKIVCNQT
jgi:hypothetical protein